MFEGIHFSLFFVLVMFLMLSLFMLLAAAETFESWVVFREFIRKYEKNSVRQKTQARTVHDFGRAACEEALDEQMDSFKARTKKCTDHFSLSSPLLGKIISKLPLSVVNMNPFLPEVIRVPHL